MTPKQPRNERVAAIVLAAGAASRFGPANETPKQFLDLGGEPVVVRSVRAMLGCEAVRTAVCAVAAAWREHAGRLLEKAGLASRITLVEGGATRQASAQHALAALAGPEAPAVVLIHDAARPLVPPDAVHAALLAARDHGAAVVAGPAVDTTAVSDAGFLTTVLERSALVCIQTPQAFRYDVICEAHRHAAEEGVTDATDDATLVLRLGHQVAVVPGPVTNIKITSAADLEFARLLLGRQATSA